MILTSMNNNIIYNSSRDYESPKIEILVVENRSAICDYSYVHGNHDGTDDGGGI